MPVILETKFSDLKFVKKGKVRDIYELDGSLLIVATDRLSAFDVVFRQGIPEKGKVLTQIAKYWFEQVKDVIPNHLISTEVSDFPALKKYAKELKDRIMVVKNVKPVMVECIVRGYLSGSGWSEYQKSGSICGIKLPKGLVESDKLPEPIFTPTSKAEVGVHDENITFEDVIKMIGEKLANELRQKAIAVYKKASQIAEKKGLIIADTKFEFGMDNGNLILIDEILTPDSSRFWPKDQYKPGGAQPSFDKQFVRDYLIEKKWNKKPPAPDLPEEIIRKTSEKYLEALKKITS
ncbi:MAG: phosphoribosylaminoimidazolesuccinocarboxamide synthase [Candidatus Firestonebacteria bacterium RIFOXYA2_FULL_40_8]|nr:MAG: phosphoribosylaminoimidazolesuccinocarboxamide synthase [Candidatus Firestonebacteria bacterium RIFOXYA2_FULL_40_8]